MNAYVSALLIPRSPPIPSHSYPFLIHNFGAGTLIANLLTKKNICRCVSWWICKARIFRRTRIKLKTNWQGWRLLRFVWLTLDLVLVFSNMRGEFTGIRVILNRIILMIIIGFKDYLLCSLMLSLDYFRAKNIGRCAKYKKNTSLGEE